MIELLGLFAFVAVGVFLVGAVAVGFVMLKLVVWLLFLPFRLLGWLLFLPFLLLKGLFGVLIRCRAAPDRGHRWRDRCHSHRRRRHPAPGAPADLGTTRVGRCRARGSTRRCLTDC